MLRKGLLPAMALLLLLASCRVSPPEKIDYVIGVSNSSMLEEWRIQLNRELKEEADRYPFLSVIFTDAASRSDKQIRDIEKLMGYGIDLLIISPCDVERMTPIISAIYETIPVIILDRVVDGYDYTLFIGPDNDNIGRLGALALHRLLGEEGGRVLEISGPMDQLSSRSRSRGLHREVEESYPSIVMKDPLIVSPQNRDRAEDLLLEEPGRLEGIDAIYTHTDGLALGVSRALEKLDRADIPIVGTDNPSGENGGFDLVDRGLIHSTVESSTGGREAVRYALDILNRRTGVPKQIILRSRIVTRDNRSNYTPMPVGGGAEDGITLGYAQVGTESQWRVSNTKSIIQAAKDFDIDLIYRDADQNQEAQIGYLREFIEKKVDAILLSPIVEEGYEEVLGEAKEAGIPVLLSDRKIDSPDEELYMTFIGGDFKEEGRRAARWISRQYPGQSVRILELWGTNGATPTEERHEGFAEIIDGIAAYDIVYAGTGNFTRDGGYAIVSDYLETHAPPMVDVIFAHNDDMILGAIDAIRERGLKPGVDIKLISVDGTRAALNALKKGDMNFVVECTPLLGDQVMKAVLDLMQGKDLPMRIVTDERTFEADQVDDGFIRRRSY
ncbi:MAG: substrate-binding domain-containing protein [Spirochaetales bacterium]|nr:substrate-binding domain-containing protein [Spirochaetales bacterium]